MRQDLDPGPASFSRFAAFELVALNSQLDTLSFPRRAPPSTRQDLAALHRPPRSLRFLTAREHDHTSKGTLGITAFLALLLGLAYCGFGVLVSGHGPALRIASVLLLLCAVFGLITTALMTVTSVIVDRARLSS